MTHSEAIYKVGRDLTPRMKEMCRLLVTGHTTNGEIAEAMHVRPDTVKQYVHGALIITGMGNKVELALFVERNWQRFI